MLAAYDHRVAALPLAGDTVAVPLGDGVELALDELLAVVCGVVCAVQMVDSDASAITNMATDKEFGFLGHAMVVAFGATAGGQSTSGRG